MNYDILESEDNTVKETIIPPVKQLFFFLLGGSLVLDRHSFQVVKSLELLSCVLGWEWTLNDLIVKNVWQILKSWAEKETRNELTTNGLQLQAASSSEENRLSACCCGDFIVSSEVSSVTVLADEGTNGRSGFTTTGEEKEGGNQVGGEEVPEICPKCGKLTGSRLPESQAVLCIQLLGTFTVNPPIASARLKAGFHSRRSRSRKRAYNLVKIENVSRKRSHNRDEIGVGRMRTFLTIPFTIAYGPRQTIANGLVKTRLSESEAEAEKLTNHKARIEHCDWINPPLLLPTRQSSFH